MTKRELADRLCELAKTARGLAANGGGQDPAYGTQQGIGTFNLASLPQTCESGQRRRNERCFCAAKDLSRPCLNWVIRDRAEPASGRAMSAMPPKAEVKSGSWHLP